jgi:F0F1-type ATP synthase assembly protein I
MPKGDSESEADRLARSMRAAQDTVGRAGPAASAGYTLIGAILVLGGIGYAADRWRGTSPWFLVSGLFLGMAVGFYELIKTTRPPR